MEAIDQLPKPIRELALENAISKALETNQHLELLQGEIKNRLQLESAPSAWEELN
jgi:FixJ family two-component response regulator